MKVRCEICGKSFYKISASHLKLHGLTRADYIAKFGTQGVSCVQCVKKEVEEIEMYFKEKTIKRSSFMAKETQRFNLIKRVV